MLATELRSEFFPNLNAHQLQQQSVSVDVSVWDDDDDDDGGGDGGIPLLMVAYV